MKKTILIGAILLFLLPCCVKVSDAEKIVHPPPERIKEIERKGIDGGSLYLVDVDGHLYLLYSKGGILHAESCPCKQKNDTIK